MVKNRSIRLNVQRKGIFGIYLGQKIVTLQVSPLLDSSLPMAVRQG